MGSMGKVPMGELAKTLDAHIRTLVLETIAYVHSKDNKHMNIAKTQLLDFILVNFTPKGD